MSDMDEAASGPATGQRRASDWRPLAWVLLGVTIVLVLASIFGNGTGMFGWGWMMGMMWLWMLLPLVLIGVVVYLLMESQRRAGRREGPR